VASLVDRPGEVSILPFTLLAATTKPVFVVVVGGETGALMTIARETNWAAHLYVYLALVSLGVLLLYLALAGPERFAKRGGSNDEDD
jgi:hypothetical protein